ncbi:MAG: hypothetical protein JSR24_10495 [Proteobacteria bacterium]|nr:hypothetical protein [Pseudomonadota bacterium]
METRSLHCAELRSASVGTTVAKWFILLAAGLVMSACGNTPASDGRYATFDHGNNNRGGG